MDEKLSIQCNYKGQVHEIVSLSFGSTIKNLFCGGNKVEENAPILDDKKYSFNELKSILGDNNVSKVKNIFGGGYSELDGDMDMDRFLSLLNKNIATKQKDDGGMKKKRRNKNRGVYNNEMVSDDDYDRYSESCLEKLPNEYMKN